MRLFDPSAANIENIIIKTLVYVKKNVNGGGRFNVYLRLERLFVRLLCAEIMIGGWLSSVRCREFAVRYMG